MASLEDKEEHHEDWNEENYHANGVYVGQELEDPRDGVRTLGDADGEGKADEEDDDYDLDVRFTRSFCKSVMLYSRTL